MGHCIFPKPKGDINYGVIRAHKYFLKFMIAAR